MFSVFSLKMHLKKHFCSKAGNQLLYYVQQLMCLFLFVNIVHVCVICLTQISMHQSNICYTNECIKSTAVSYICNYILLHQYFFYQKCFECVTWNFLGHNYYLNVVLNYQYDIDVVTDEQVSQGTIYIQTLYVWLILLKKKLTIQS